ncbi:MAG: hypothetical protein RLZZ293_788 [Pseudomonadota bacterium]|jgi:cell wall-associated NlpC family hydrolase
MKLWSKIKFCCWASLFYFNYAQADNNIKLVNLARYSQQVSNWFNPLDPDYDKRLLSESYQQQRLADFYQHYYASDTKSLSPWASNWVNNLLANHESNNLLVQQKQVLAKFSQNSLLAIGMNYHVYSVNWFDKISANMNLTESISLSYNPQQRAIIVDNTYLRVLPTSDPLFHDAKIAGEGYPFDNLQDSALFIGQPIYVVKYSRDGEWSLVISNDGVGWIKTNSLAMVDDKFIDQWQQLAKAGIVGVIQQHSAMDKQHKFRAMLYNGTTLPLIESNLTEFQIALPVANLERQALIISAYIDINSGAKLPLAFTQRNLATIISHQLGKTYGWGNLLFNYDCSAETKALFTPFAIYLPRGSQQQYQAGKVVNLDSFSAKQREEYLLHNGHKLLTLIQVPGHIMLYIGNYSNLYTVKSESMVAMTYQNMWGMRTAKNDNRSIIGGAVFFPLLESYPENSQWISFYDQQRSKFRLIFLDQ